MIYFQEVGALAIEALSRGASSAIVCDNSKKAVNIIKKNLENTKLDDKAEILNCDYLEAIKKLQVERKKFNIVFLDPPYKSNFVYNSTEKIIKYDLLEEDGIIAIETDDENKIEEIKNIKGIEIYDARKYGIVHIIFIRKG